MQPNPAMILVEKSWLTHLPLDKMAAILAALYNAFSWMKMTEFQFESHWNLFPGDKPLPEPMTTQFTDANNEGILPKGSYPPCLGMADRALLAGHPQYMRH